jgi:hypothetical protein
MPATRAAALDLDVGVPTATFCERALIRMRASRRERLAADH